MAGFHYRSSALNLRDAVSAVLLGSPVAVLVWLLRNPPLDRQLQAPALHFVIVTLAAGIALAVGVMVLIVAERLREARAFSLGMAFCAIAGFLFIHGLLTPGFVLREFSRSINWAPLLALLLGAMCLALSTARHRPGDEPWVFRYRRVFLAALFAGWLGFLVLSIAAPRLLDWHPASLSEFIAAQTYTPSPHQGHDEYGGYGPAPSPMALHAPWVAGSLSVVTATLLLATALRYAHTYRLTRTPLHAAIVAGLVFLLESLFSFFFASVWRVSWWEYHVLILLGFSTILYGLVLDYRRDASLTRTISALLLHGSVEALEQSYNEVLTALASAVEAKDPYTRGHSEKVARMAVEVGEQLGLPPERLRLLYQAGLLHDVGKIGIPDDVLNKPGRLTAAEFGYVRGHPARAEEMIARIPSLRPTLPAVRWHHERLDGSGYPDGLAGDAIPLEARIMAVADVYDAMTSGRSYRPAQSEAVALRHLTEEATRLFDARCVDALVRVTARRESVDAGAARKKLEAPGPRRPLVEQPSRP